MTNRPDIGILIVDDQEMVRGICRQVVESLGYQAFLAESGSAAIRLLEQHPVDIVVADLKMPGMSGMELLEHIKAENSKVEVILMTAYGSVPSAVQAMRLGAFDYIAKPFSAEEMKLLIQRLLKTLDLKDENRYLRERVRCGQGFGRLVGQSQQMQRIFKVIQRVAPSRAPVLILGESGTGKEVVARSIHENSPWRDKPFVPVDCAALVPTLVESELFGYVRGAFTGALRGKEGLLQITQGGTLFLDEVAELPVELQTRLLRAIQEKEFKPVGGIRRIAFDARILAATNRDLQAAIEQGSFRKDLFFRLNVVTIALPPLRERKVDIPLLAEQILHRLTQARRAGRHRERPERPERHERWTLSSEALDKLLAYDWPGNVRELENCLERAITLGSGPLIRALDLPSNIQVPLPSATVGLPESVIPLEEMERQSILRALAGAGGDKLLAARLLGIGKTTLYRKLRKYQQKG
ncbi:MAG: sigma-54-dependent Fis family transcriptional regulator [Acidobacteria bacterium]|nr:sigma-54-dependent Fis family transcriptional regulator [Acidobacteriota bacterium]